LARVDPKALKMFAANELQSVFFEGSRARAFRSAFGKSAIADTNAKRSAITAMSDQPAMLRS